MSTKILSFAEALDQAKGHKHLLLGNGFSIALKLDIFRYGALFDNADFSASPHAKKVFDALGIRDFEAVIRLLVEMAKALKAYPDASQTLIDQINKDADAIKDILVNAIAGTHPDHPFQVSDDQMACCRRFLSYFEHKYTLNYDLLLYWAVMRDGNDQLDLHPDDGFRHPEDDDGVDYVTWQEGNKATIHYLHGALHLFDTGPDLVKYTWSRTGIRIIDQVRQALKENKYPLFVAEGTSNNKLTKITHCAYLHKALRSFSEITGSLFIFGHSLAKNDEHILRIIEKGKLQHVFISVFGDASNSTNKEIISRAQRMIANRGNVRPLKIYFFDANSANVWNCSTESSGFPDITDTEGE